MSRRLRNGKIQPPTSIADATERLVRTRHEISRVEIQLDARRVSENQPDELYQTWRRRASHALICLKKERDQLVAWLGSEEPKLLRAAYSLIKTLESELDDLSREERALIAQLDTYFEPITHALTEKGENQ
jgi:hypothetical protein